ncbi:glycine/D-amino acid oxidase-like deaminating enzyme [Labrys wisconsinensis]|uniref:Glycine/D-amino acid oxidase-like deaminating enzyme n=2 Tax=Labrys wisconsinensis TaxID=425677 RepID=A0ABU0J0K5_9HYPH|nr:FAD-binding oxidoreductase [Labrys wisconsinensis]MDQ0467797.1 glycine/D-amino acid oxidase-like deaminating enzyme [Labrys wisconsinensis]
MGPQVDPVPSDPALPARADVVIVGGGIIGTSAALYLSQRGVSVVLCEKGHIAGEQSSRNWGWVRKARRDPREIPLVVESLRLWEGLNQAVGAETGFRRTGIVFAAETEAEVARGEAWIELARPYQIEARMVAGAELDRLMPGARWKAALYCPTDGRAEPQKAAPAIAAAARRAGATILTGCAVRGLDRAGGKVAAVVTERGRIACDAVVVAAGAWSRRFLRDVGLTLPQLKVRASVLRTAPIEGAPETALWCGDAAFRKRLDGGYTIANGHVNVVPVVPDSVRFFADYLPALRMGWSDLRLRLDGRFLQEWREAAPVPLDQVSPYEEVRVLDPAPDRRYLAAALASLARQFPAFVGARVLQEWAGLIDVMPDAVPVISPVDAVPGLVVATGFSGHGFGIGPGAGRLVADLVTGAPPLVDPRDFRFSRFSDGSRPRPIAGF